MSDLNLTTVVKYHRPNTTNSCSEDFFYKLMDIQSAPLTIGEYTRQGIAFMASAASGPLSDGTQLIPLYCRKMTYASTGGEYHILVTDEQWESHLWTTVTTLFVFPPSLARYGATKLHGWYSLEDEKVHYYATDTETPAGRTWRAVGASTMASVCPIPTIRMLGGDRSTPLSTSTSQFTNGARHFVPHSDLNIYPSTGNLVQFEKGSGETWSFKKIELQHIGTGSSWTFMGSASGQQAPFVRCIWNDDCVIIGDDNVGAPLHGQYKYTVTVEATDGTEYKCDPKVINRAGSSTTQPNPSSSTEGAAGAGAGA